jgi:hypothetical protein
MTSKQIVRESNAVLPKMVPISKTTNQWLRKYLCVNFFMIAANDFIPSSYTNTVESG